MICDLVTGYIAVINRFYQTGCAYDPYEELQ
jgi:hypothetical protein